MSGKYSERLKRIQQQRTEFHAGFVPGLILRHLILKDVVTRVHTEACSVAACCSGGHYICGSCRRKRVAVTSLAITSNGILCTTGMCYQYHADCNMTTERHFQRSVDTIIVFNRHEPIAVRIFPNPEY